MSYIELAKGLLEKMQLMHKAKPQKYINESLQGEMFILKYISIRNTSVLPGEISNEMGVSSARIATALNNLERKNLITRQIDKNDRRKILVEITKEGKQVVAKQDKILINIVAHILETLGGHDAKEYVRITGKLAQAATKISFNCEHVA